MRSICLARSKDSGCSKLWIVSLLGPACGSSGLFRLYRFFTRLPGFYAGSLCPRSVRSKNAERRTLMDRMDGGSWFPAGAKIGDSRENWVFEDVFGRVLGISMGISIKFQGKISLLRQKRSRRRSLHNWRLRRAAEGDGLGVRRFGVWWVWFVFCWKVGRAPKRS